MLLHLVRHADAGRRIAPSGHRDGPRQLSSLGQQQAQAVADLLGDRPIGAVITSPAERCRQTVEPLAGRLGLEVVTDERLWEGTPVDLGLALLTGVGVEAALCSHGDLIPALIGTLTARGMKVERPDRCAKGSVWSVEADNGRFVRASYSKPRVLTV